MTGVGCLAVGVAMFDSTGVGCDVLVEEDVEDVSTDPGDCENISWLEETDSIPVAPESEDANSYRDDVPAIED